MASGCRCTSGFSRAHRFLIRVFLLIQLPYEAHTPIDSVGGAPWGLRLELPPPVWIPRIVKYIQANAVLHPQQGSCQRCPAASITVSRLPFSIPPVLLTMRRYVCGNTKYENTGSSALSNTYSHQGSIDQFSYGPGEPLLQSIVTGLVMLSGHLEHA